MAIVAKIAPNASHKQETITKPKAKRNPTKK